MIKAVQASLSGASRLPQRDVVRRYVLARLAIIVRELSSPLKNSTSIVSKSPQLQCHDPQAEPQASCDLLKSR
jgi:hypothetical protein